MWVYQADETGYRIGYYSPNGNFVTTIKADVHSPLSEIIYLVNILNGGTGNFDFNEMEQILHG